MNNSGLTATIGGASFSAIRLEGIEDLSTYARYEFDILFPQSASPISINSHAALSCTSGAFTRVFTGVVTMAEAVGIYAGGQTYRVVIEASLGQLTTVRQARIWQADSFKELVSQILSEHGFTPSQWRWSVQKKLTSKPYWQQAETETDFDFLKRLLASEGVFIVSQPNDAGDDMLLFTDNNNALILALPDSVRYRALSNTSLANALSQPTVHDLAMLHTTTGLSMSGKTHLPVFSAGSCVNINADEFDASYSATYVLTRVVHHATGSDYHNEFTAIPSTAQYQVTPIYFPAMPPVLTARIDATTAQNALDSEGASYTKLHFDRRDTETGEALPALVRVQTNPGIHLPAAPNSDVLVSYHQGDPDQLYILASVPNDDHRSPVTAMSSTQHRWRTPQGQETVFEDSASAPYIHIKTHDELNRLQLNAKAGAQQINVESLLGEVRLSAEGSLAINAFDWFESSVENHMMQVQSNYQNSTQQGDIHQQSQKDITEQAKQTIRQQAGQDIRLLSGNDASFDATQNFTASSTDGQLCIHAQQGDVIIQSVEAAQLIGSGKGIMSLNNAQSGMQIDASGNIILYGQNFQAIASNGIQLKGKVSYNNSASAPATPEKPNISKPDDIEVGTIDPDAKVTFKRDELILQLIDPVTQNPITDAEWLNNLSIELRDVELINGEDKAYWQVQDSLLGHWTKEGYWRTPYMDLSKAKQIKLCHSKSNQVYYCIAQDGTVCYPQDTLIMKNDASKQTSKTDKKNNTVQQRILKLTLLRNDIRFNFRADQAEPSKMITSFSAAELNALKANGNNVTLFIHGYGVAYGKMGSAFNIQRDADGKATIESFSDQNTNLYREPQNKLLEPYSNGALYSSDNVLINYQLNGSEAQNWFTLMSHHLNKATGQFDGKDYSKYTPVVGIAWQGDPENPLDYMSAVDSAKNTAPLFTALVKQLLDANIEVNIIAHSLGNAVLMHSLNTLGQGSYANKINHVFMWEAAIPDNSFATEKPTDSRMKNYYFPTAYQGAKTISVLYSNEDNVLGPISRELTSFETFWRELNDKNANVAEIAATWLISKIDQDHPDLHLESVYHMVNMIGQPLSGLIESADQRNAFYTQCCNTYGSTSNSLDAQVTTFKQSNSRDLKIMAELFACIDLLLPVSAYDKANGILSMALDAIIKIEASVFSDSFDTYSNDTLQMAALVLNCLLTPNAKIRPAMGYSGVDKPTLDKLGARLISVNQKNWLTSHSAMRIPSQDLMKHIYEDKIIGADGYNFGRYT